MSVQANSHAAVHAIETLSEELRCQLGLQPRNLNGCAPATLACKVWVKFEVRGNTAQTVAKPFSAKPTFSGNMKGAAGIKTPFDDLQTPPFAIRDRTRANTLSGIRRVR